MKALVTAASKSSNSPTKKKKQELQEQLYCEPRYRRVKALANDLETTSVAEAHENKNSISTDAVEALMALCLQGPIIPM